VLAWSRDKADWAGDWKFYSLLANSKLVMLVSAAFTFVPLALSVLKVTDSQYMLPFTAYAYWISGLSFSLFLIVYKLNAPTIYKFSTFEDLMAKEGGVFVLQKDAGEVIKEIEGREIVAKAYNPKGLLLADKKVMEESFKRGSTHDAARVYYVMKEYSSLFKSRTRFTLFALFILPAFLITTVTAIKTVVVGVEAYKAVDVCGGLGPAIYQEILDLGKGTNETPTCPKRASVKN
jgi:hypothetical protein